MHKICSICSIYFGGYNRIQFKEEETAYNNNFSSVCWKVYLPAVLKLYRSRHYNFAVDDALTQIYWKRQLPPYGT